VGGLLARDQGARGHERQRLKQPIGPLLDEAELAGLSRSRVPSDRGSVASCQADAPVLSNACSRDPEVGALSDTEPSRACLRATPSLSENACA
jgi:hypothetical protein